MKKLYIILTFGLLFSKSSHSQNYVPLILDSLYNYSWIIGLHGDTISNESWSAFSYNENDTLIQRRNPYSRQYYSYAPDTLYLINETLDTANNWYLNSTTTTAYKNDKIVYRLTERVKNGTLENSALHRYFYDDSFGDTLYLLQHWRDGLWEDFYKKEKKFDENGNNIEEAIFYEQNGDFIYNRGKLFEYDNTGKLIEETGINTSSNGPYFTSKNTWIYGNDNLLDTIIRCNYSFSNNETCNNVFMATYDYIGEDSIVENRFQWDGGWKYYGNAVTFKGPEIYSNKPDSIIFYQYWEDTQTHSPFERRYFQYEDLGNDSIYLKEEEYDYYLSLGEWKLSRFKEEWYHAKPEMVEEEDEEEEEDTSNEPFSIFPNPSKVGQGLTLKGEILKEEDLEILVFDMQGKLISREILTDQSILQAPFHEGVYTILVRKGGKLIGFTKHVIVE